VRRGSAAGYAYACCVPATFYLFLLLVVTSISPA
jgi:hypothetical protein